MRVARPSELKTHAYPVLAAAISPDELSKWFPVSFQHITDAQEVPDWTKHVIATAISKYVFKLGRFTIHPAIMLEANGMLPERPGEGWRGGASETGTPDELGDIDEVILATNPAMRVAG